MATHERTTTSKSVLRKLGILAIGASLALTACGTAAVRSGTIQTAGDGQSVLRDPANPSWSHNTAVVEAGARRSVLGDSGNPYWSHNTATPAPDDGVDQRGLRPY
jgi:hypothetical protein